MKLPNFIIVGAAKCGTSSAWAYLRQHPDVFMPQNKEPNYFALRDVELPERGPADPDTIHELLYSYSITGRGDYEGLFRPVNGEEAVGEASVRYLYSEDAAEAILRELPGVRIVIMLRNPVSRLYSHYCMNRQYGIEPLPLFAAVDAEEERRRDGWGYDWHYVGVGRYHDQVARYLDMFGAERVHIQLFEDFVADPAAAVRAIFGFIGVDDGFVPDTSWREKAAYRPRSISLDRWLNPPGRNGARAKAARLAWMPGPVRHRTLGFLRKVNAAKVEKLDEASRKRLREHFAEDIDKTAGLLGRELPW